MGPTLMESTGRSSQINITDANIGTGYDCISVGDGTQDISIN